MYEYESFIVQLETVNRNNIFRLNYMYIRFVTKVKVFYFNFHKSFSYYFCTGIQKKKILGVFIEYTTFR